MRRSLQLGAMLAVLPAAFAQGIITTRVGNDWVFQGDGRAAVNAPLGRVARITVDRAGAIYLADTDNHMVFKITPDGILRIVAGNGTAGFAGDNGPATKARLDEPSGVAVDAAGNLYIADTNNERVRKVTPAGVISTFAGTGEYGFLDNIQATLGKMRRPADVAADSAGNIFISEGDGNRVRKVSPDGIITTAAGTGEDGFGGDGGPAARALLSQPRGIFVDARNQLYIADAGNQRIRRVATDGVIRTLVGPDDGLQDAGAVAVDAAGNIYVAESSSNRILKVGPSGGLSTIAGAGQQGYSPDGTAPLQALFNYPLGVAVDAAGNVYIADSGNSRVRKVTPAGVLSTFAGNGNYKFGGDGGPASAALLRQPRDLILDRDGNIYISDSLNNRVRKIDRAGIITTVAGDGFARFAGDGGAATRASLNQPVGLALDTAGNLYIADLGNQRIRRVDNQGTITTLAGGGEDEDATDPVLALLTDPMYLLFDGSGNLLFSEPSSFLVRRITPARVLSTVAGNRVGAYTGDGGPATAASLEYPGGLALDAANNLYIGEIFNGRVRRVAANGNISTFAGTGGACCVGDGGPATRASLDVEGLSTDASGSLYVGGSAGLVRKIAANGIITTLAGGGAATVAALGDGGPALTAFLNSPVIARADAGGNVYIVDRFNDRIRLLLNVDPGYTVAPATLLFSGKSGGAPALPQSLLVTSQVTNLVFNVSIETAQGSWLTATPERGLAPGRIEVIADPSGLPPGEHEGRVLVTAPNSPSGLRAVNVRFTVTPADAPTLVVEPNFLNFDFTQGLPGNEQNFFVRNNGSGKLDFSIAVKSTSGGDFLSVTPLTGSVTASTPADISVTANPGNLPPGTYSGLITIQSPPSKTALVPVTMTVHSTAQTIVLSESGLAFFAVAGAATVQQEFFAVLNSGLGTLNWSASSKVLSGGTNWLSVNPPTGASGPAGTNAGFVTINVNSANLAAGDYYGLVTIESPGAANTPQVLSVVLSIDAAGTTSVDTRPTGLIFVPQPNGEVASQDVQVTNLGASAGSFRATGVADNGAPFFTVKPSQGSLPPGQPVRISVQANAAGVTGARRGTITLEFDNGATDVVEVVLVVPVFTPAPPTGAKFERGAGTCTPTSLNQVFSLLGDQFSTKVSFPTPIEVRVVDSCGVDLDKGSIVASFSNGDIPISLTAVGGGRWSGTWQPSIKAGPVEVTALAETEDRKLRGTFKVSGMTTSGSRAPRVNPGGVISTASRGEATPIAPGSLIAIYGANLSDDTVVTSDVPRPIQLNQTLAVLGGVALPLLFVSDGQVNAMVPYGIAVNTSQQLLLQNNNAQTVPISIPVAAAQPAIFGPGGAQGFIYGAKGLADKANPAAAGEVVVIYCAGLGAVDQPMDAGTAAPFSPLARTVNQVRVTFGGAPGGVSFSGLTPGFTGLYQINVEVPRGVTPGDVEVLITVAGQTSAPGVMMTVK